MNVKFSAMGDNHVISLRNNMKKQDNFKNHFSKEVMPGSDLWKDGLICAFEYVRGRKERPMSKSSSRQRLGNGQDTKAKHLNTNNPAETATFIEIGDQIENHNGNAQNVEVHMETHWVPIGWARLSELVQTVHVDAGWASQPIEFTDDENHLTVADVAAPYWQRAAGPTWWCHVTAGHHFVDAWLSNAQWLHPAISIALRDESRLISDRMKYIRYEVPVRVAGGLLFELLGQSVGDPFVDEDDIPIVLRSFQAQNFLITAMHVKGNAANINVLGITEVQELLASGGCNAPRTVLEVIAQLVSRLSRWDDRMFRKYIFGAADEVELKFMNRRNHEDMNFFSLILNQEIRRMSRQVIRVKWSLHAREEIVFELLQHLKGCAQAKSLLEGVRKNTREMIEEQEAVRGRLFTIQDVMQSTVRAWLQDRSLRVTHNLAVFGGCGLVLSIITGLFGINVDGIPGAQNTPYAFLLFTCLLAVIGLILVVIGLVYLGLKRPITDEQVQVRKLELQQLVKMFQHEAETHAKVRQEISRNSLPPTAADMLLDTDVDYFLIR